MSDQQFGAEAGRHRKNSAEALFYSRPETASAIEEAGLSRSELAKQAGVGRETLRRALYGAPGRGSVREDTARKIAAGLTRAAVLSGEREEAIVEEILSLPK